MNNESLGRLIAAERKKHGWTQSYLAERLLVSDKAVSKWERGLGCPDVAILPQIAEVFQISLDSLINGDLSENKRQNVSFLQCKFYFCPICGNVIAAAAPSEVSCCGRRLNELCAQEATEEHRLDIARMEDEYYLTGEHPMEKEHYLAFAAWVDGDTVILKRTFPQWDFNVRFPYKKRGILYFYCTKDGLFKQKIN